MTSNAKSLNSIFISISLSTLHWRELELTRDNFSMSLLPLSTFWIPRALNFLKLVSFYPTMLFLMSLIQWNILILVLFALVSGLMVSKMSLLIGLRTIYQSYRLLLSFTGTPISRKSKQWEAIQWEALLIMWNLRNSKKSSCSFRNTMLSFRRKNSTLRVLLSNHNPSGPLSRER